MPENLATTAEIQKHLDARSDAREAERDANFHAIMAAIADLKAQYNRHWQTISALSGRVTVLESRHQ